MDTPSPESETSSRLRRALAFLRPHRGAVCIVLCIALALAVANAFEPLILRYIFDRLQLPKGLRALGYGVGMLVGLGLLREAGNAISNWLSWRTRISVHYGLMESTVGRLHTLPISFHRDEGVGATMTKLERGIQGLVAALTEIACNVVPAAVYLGIAVAVMLRLNWRLALLVIAFAPVPALIQAFAAPAQTRRERTLMDRWVRIYSRFNEVLSSIVMVKSFAMEEVEKRRFLHDVDEANQVVIHGVATDSRVSAAQNLVVLVARVLAIAYGGYLVTRGQVSLGGLVAFLGYIGGLFAPVQGLSSTYRTLRVAAVSLEHVFAILDAHDRLEDAPDAVELQEVKGNVAFDHVKFSYHAGLPLLQEINIDIRAGETVALVGPSGAGKTTLMSLLQRLYDPTHGSVRVDGRDIRTFKQQSLRQQIGVVLQESLLFNESIRDNIAYGRPQASQAEIEAAARAANAHDFITRLPQGYDTQVGERGCRLSSGERQRVAIARSLLKDPPILILDEPTSALDAESEELVQQALARLSKGRTTFAIAHRLSTVVDADRILVMKGGRIIESGRHAELMALDGYYASLVKSQTRGLISARAA